MIIMMSVLSSSSNSSSYNSSLDEQLELHEGPASGLLRLLLLSFTSVSGSLGSLFILSALTVVPSLQRNPGHAFLASSALGHLFVTSGVLPSICLGIMSGMTGMCQRLQWPFIKLTLLTHLHSFLLLSIDSAFPSMILSSSRFSLLSSCLFLWTADVVVVVLSSLHDHDDNDDAHHDDDESSIVLSRLDICHAKEQTTTGDSSVVIVCFFILIGLPILLTLIFFLKSFFRNNNTLNANYYSSNYSFSHQKIKTHVIVYVLSLILMTPLLIVVFFRISSSDSVSFAPTSVVWTFIASSVSYSFVYAFLDREFGDSFLQLFYYCCCKSHVNWNSSRKGPLVMSSSTTNQTTTSSVTHHQTTSSMIPLMSMTSHSGVGSVGHHNPTTIGHHGYHHPVMTSNSNAVGGPFRAFSRNPFPV